MSVQQVIIFPWSALINGWIIAHPICVWDGEVDLKHLDVITIWYLHIWNMLQHYKCV